MRPTIKVTDNYITELYKKYEEGKTLSELGFLIGISSSTIRKWFKAKNLKLRRIYNPKTRKTVYLNGNNFSESRIVWEYYNGMIPKGYLIHHKDLNQTNNEIFNLEMMTYSEHKKLHHKIKNGKI